MRIIIKALQIVRGLRADKFFIEVDRKTLLQILGTKEKNQNFIRWLSNEVYNALREVEDG